MSVLAPEIQKRLSEWGLHGRILREQARDDLLEGQPPLTAEQREQAMPRYLQRHHIASQDQLQRWMAREGLDQQDLETLAVRELQWCLLLEQRFRGAVSTLFLKRKSELDQVVYSALWLEDQGLAHELFLQLKERENTFEQLTCTLPPPPSESLPMGKLGPTPLGSLPPALAELLRVSRPGQIWPPKAAEGGWLLIRLEEIQPAVFNAGLRQSLLLELGEQLLQEQMSGSSSAASAA